VKRLALAVLVLAMPTTARAAEDCATHYERAQELRLDGHLRAAQEDLLSCAQNSCPAFIRNDCTKWLDEVQAAQPTVVFVARQAGRDVAEVTVTCNEQLLADRLDGRAILIDPGRQQCRLEAAGAEPATVELLVVEGQKGRLVEVDLVAIRPPPRPRPAPPPPPPARSPAPLVLAGVGAAGLAGFVALGASGLSSEHRLRDLCAPDCSSSDVRSVRTRYAFADVSLGIGIVSAAIAGYLFWHRDAERAPSVAVSVGDHGGGLSIGSTF
jgi:hypothetical protein